ncbi:MAG TPA: ATP-binding protein [Gemmatimonadales bacterium]|nr:ATP-binding protein [Gemmatimonadales bacterium]
MNRYVRALPIRQKVALLVAAASIAGLVLAGGAVVAYELTTYRPRLVADARTQADLIRVNSTAALQFNDDKAAAENLATLRARPEILGAALFDADGRMVARYAAPGAPPPPRELAEGVRFLPGQLLVIERIVVDGQLVGWLSMRYVLPSFWQRLPGYGIMALVVLLALVTTGLLLLGMLGRSVTQPLLALTGAAREISRTGRYRLRVPDRAGDEIGELTDAFNRMVATVEVQQTALQRNETRLRLALEAARMESWHLDRSRGIDACLAELLERVHPDDRESVARAIRAADQAQRGFAVEFRAPGAEERWVAMRGQPFAGDDGADAHLIGVAQDVTEQRQIARQLVQSQRMEAIGNLAGGIAHDFNNLLTGMLGYLGFISRRLPPDSPLHADVAQVDRAARRAALLTSQLLSYARRQMVVPTVLDLNATVGNLEPMIRRLVGEDVQVVTDLDEDLGATRVDAGQMEQVLLNLVANARDAMPQGGTVRIHTRNVERDRPREGDNEAAAPGAYVAVEVSDTGVGMTPEVLARAFEPFFTTKPVGAGTGLGLAMCYGIARQSGGHIEVESEPGKGSRFTVLLPRVARPDGAAAAGAPPEPQRGQGTILLVEDDPTVRELAVRMLRDQGYTVLSAEHSAAALECAERHRGAIQLLLTDVVMPGGRNGRELAELVTAMYPGVPVLYMSGYTVDVVLRQGLVQEGVAFLAKPFTEAELGRAVRQAMTAVVSG